jgi:hypothetical protein
MSPYERSLSQIVLILCFCFSAALSASAAQTYPYPSLQSGYSENLYSTVPLSAGVLGGIAVAPNGDVWAKDCNATQDTFLFDASRVVTENGTVVHPLVQGNAARSTHRTTSCTFPSPRSQRISISVCSRWLITHLNPRGLSARFRMAANELRYDASWANAW